jgi:hypothetical protein
MSTKTFKKGDRVYCILHGWGTVKQISKTGTYPILVSINNGEKETCSFTLDGRYFEDSIPTLSFTEYTLNGFSQERPIELPEVGEEIMVSNDRDNWVIREFVRYNPNNAHHVVVCEGDCAFRYFKRLR